MPRQRFVVAGLGVVMVIVSLGLLGAGQLPLAPSPGAGRSVTPVYEGWYENPDGTYSLSFGYFNRNTEEELDIPIGPNNRFEPGNPDRGQPTHFMPRRDRGAFVITVPADFGDQTLTWTLVSRGETLSIPGQMLRDWQLDALEGAASGNTPPMLKFDPAGSEGKGPGGLYAAPLTVTLPYPVMLTIWRTDPERPEGDRGGGGGRGGRGGEPAAVTVKWVKYRGPGTVTFAEPEPTVENGLATTTATFSEPGDYILRVLAGTAGGNQCCWTNGYVRVTARQ